MYFLPDEKYVLDYLMTYLVTEITKIGKSKVIKDKTKCWVSSPYKFAYVSNIFTFKTIGVWYVNINKIYHFHCSLMDASSMAKRR